MRLFALVLLFSGFCASANAQECNSSGFIRPQTGYLLKSVGAVASDGPVVQGGATLTCGPWAYDVFASVGQDGGTANELDFSVFYNTEVGPFQVQLAAQYYALNLHDSLLDADDDMIEVYADVSLPMTWGRLTVAPLLRVGEVIGVDELQSLDLVQPGVRGSFRITDSITASGEIRESFNLTQDYSTFRFDSALTWQVSERTAVRLGWEGTDRTRSVTSLGVFHNF